MFYINRILITVLVLSGCAQNNTFHVRDQEIKSGPGLFSGSSGEFDLLDQGNTAEDLIDNDLNDPYRESLEVPKNLRSE